VHQITNHATAIVQDRADLADLFSKIVDIDSAQFKNQNQKFSENPILVMREALTIASGSDEMRQNYDAFMNDLVYAPDEKRPSFKEAINNFQDLFESLVQECQKDKSLDSTITKIDSPDLVSGKTIAEHLKDPAQSKRHKIDDDPQPT
jgi:hypothetical protein